MSYFLLTTCPFLAQFCIGKAFLFHMSSLYSPHSLSENHCYPNMSSFLLTTCPSLTPFSAKKDLVTQYEFFSASYMPYTGLILHHQSFVNPYELFSIKSIPLLGKFSVSKPLLPEYGLFPVNYMRDIWVLLCQLHAVYWPNSPIKMLCYSMGALFC